MANASSMPSRPINVEVNTRDLFACLITLRLEFPPPRDPHVEIRRSEISAGDHIYTPRAGDVYDHHGIYIGEDLGLVIHFQNSLDDKAALGSSIPRFGVCPDCGHHSGRSGVVLSCLNCFLRGGIIYRYEYGCRDPSILIRFMKWCTSADSDPRKTVIDRAKLLLTDGFGEYSLARNNCEDFALFCKTGEHIRSGQIMLLLFGPLFMLRYVPYIYPIFLIAGVVYFTDFDALRRKNGYSYCIRDPRRIWYWPLHCKRYLSKWKKKSIAGRISQPDSV